MNNITLTKKEQWKQASYHGKLMQAFIHNQVKLNPGYEISIRALSVKYWFELIGINKRYSQMSDEQVSYIYKKAKWLSECESLKIFKCDKCDVVKYYVDEEDIEKIGTVGLPYFFGMSIAKNTCHRLTSDIVGYGSLFDSETLELDLCERCYIKLKR